MFEYYSIFASVSYILYMNEAQELKPEYFTQRTA